MKTVLLLSAGTTALVLLGWVLSAEGFLSHSAPALQCRRLHGRDSLPIHSESSSSNGGGAPEESPLEAMRKMLEASWDAEKMGRVPMDSASGAMECVQAIMSAAMRQEGENGVFFVDLQLPSYDIRQGERLYDEVMATEFCIELSNGLEGKSEILVRDQKTLDTVQKILTVREQNLQEDDDDDGYDDDEEDDDDENDDGGVDDLVSSNVEEEIALEEEDIDSFRQKLMSGWDVTDTEPPITPQEPPRAVAPPEEPQPRRNSDNKTYRLASLFGNARIGKGGDMPQDVVRAIRDNGLALEDEQNIIILSPAGQDEMVGVRALVEKYKADKKIVLVNCQFTTMPRELQSSETVYSILPLVAKEKGTGKDLVVRKEDGSPSKVVVLRRYPKDWEIFVDVGNGFELVETVPVTASTRRGVPMEKITDCLTRYLKSI